MTFDKSIESFVNHFIVNDDVPDVVILAWLGAFFSYCSLYIVSTNKLYF